MPQRIDLERPKRTSAEKIEKAEVEDDIVGKVGKIIIADYDRKGKAGKVELFHDAGKTMYKEIGHVYYSRRKIMGKNFYHVDLTSGNYKFSGFRMLPTIYHWLVTQYDMPLQAGSQQSAGGRAMWNTLAGMKGVKLYAIQGKQMIELTSGEFGEVVGKDDEDYSPYDVPGTKVVAIKG